MQAAIQVWPEFALGNNASEVRYRFNWKTPFMLSNHNSRIFYTAGSYVFRSLDRGNNLQAISPEIARDTMPTRTE